MHFWVFLSMLSNHFCCEHLAIVAGNKVEGVSSGGMGRSAETVFLVQVGPKGESWRDSSPTSQFMYALEICM